jgi:hypothetical protein
MKKMFRDRSAPLALACCLFPLLACASASGQKLTGAVRIYGSEPHTWAGIADEKDGKVYLIDGAEMEKELRALQGARLEFRIKITPPPPYPPADGVASIISYKPVE